MTSFRLHCVVCDNAVDYFKYLVANYKDMASSQAQIEVVAHCTDDASVQKVKEQNLAHRIVAVHLNPDYYVYGNYVDVLNRIKLLFKRHPSLGGSSGHAAGLNSAFKATGGGKIDIIADTDTVIVYPEWDIFLQKILQTHAIVGTSYEDKGGASSGSGSIQTYKSSPNLTWVALSPRFPFHDVDASHRLYRHEPIKTQEQAALYGLQVGDKLLCDVGWKIPAFLKKHKASAVVLKHAKPGSPKCKVIKMANDYNEEFQLDGAPVIVHQRGSRKHPFRTQPLSAPFYDAVEAYLHEIKST
ncbi:MAG: hypothetical protein WC521_01955 [Bdellovibrionales bacterium]